MKQPVKKGVKNTIKKTRKKTSSAGTQPVGDARCIIPPKKITPQQKKKRKHPQYGTSKLEERFSNDFLEKLGVKYIYQYEMKPIKRFLDFYLPEHNIAIEVDGDYYHSYNILYENMNPMQKHNKRVDEQKDHWCLINGIKLLRIWEHDINNHKEKVMNMLKEEFSIGKDKQIKLNQKNTRH